MGDSDDEYGGGSMMGGSGSVSGGGGNSSHQHTHTSSSNSRRNRDKFHRERDDTSNPNSQQGGYNTSQRNWSSSNDSRGWQSAKSSSSSNQKPYNNQYSNNPRQRPYSQSPYQDKPKRQWESSSSNNNNNNNDQPGIMGHAPGQPNSPEYNNSFNSKSQQAPIEPEYPTQPPCLSFKQFLQQQDDSIGDDEAIRKYNEYKLEFRRTQINEFFLAHKEEDWFKSRYHPSEFPKRQREHKQSVLRRLECFMQLYSSGDYFDAAKVDVDSSDALVRFLDACVIKMEGGTEADLKALDPSEKRKASDEQSSKRRKKTRDESGNNGDGGGNGGDSGSESGAYSDDEESKDRTVSDETRQKELHKTTSIFLRNLPPSVTKEELEAYFRSQPGFKRVALSDPAPERGFLRRGWITFDASVDIRKICWNTNNDKLRDFNPSAIVNRELNRRVRPTGTHLVHHKSVVKNDIKLAAKIIDNLDKRWNLWNNNPPPATTQTEQVKAKSEDDIKRDEAGEEIVEPQPEKMEQFDFDDKEPYVFSADSNPLLDRITDYLVEEMSAEEQELLDAADGGVEGEVSNGHAKNPAAEMPIEIDEKYNKALDSLILYLRVVHSFDFYNYIEYQAEDSMPNRCGIIHARASLPQPVAECMIKQEDVDAYVAQFEAKIKPYVEYRDRLDEEAAKKLGLKDKAAEIEKFVKTNTQELAPDRWLCPLSGKKFKGPEFIRKHLFYKHAEKVDEVRRDVDFFNNYLLDPKRPQLAEHPSNRAPQQPQQSFGQAQNQSPKPLQQQQQQQQHQQAPLFANPPMMGFGAQGGGGYQSHRGGGGGGGGWQSQNQGIMGGYRGGSYGGSGYGAQNRMMGQGYYPPRHRNPMAQMMMPPRMDGREIVHYKDLDAPEDL